MTTVTNEWLQKALSSIKIEQLNPMQQAALDAAVDDNDVVLLSPTGSGKTLAFLLPLILRLSATPQQQGVAALVLAPSRELALQIEGVFKSLNTPWRSCCCYGGHPFGQEKRSIEGSQPSLIIGTPGRVLDHLDKGTFGSEQIETLVIDEFDKSLEFGFHDEMMEIVAHLPHLKKRMLLSATEAEEIPHFTGVAHCTKLDFLPQRGEEVSSRLTLKQVTSPAKDKIDTLYDLLCTLGSSSTIVFCNHRDAVDRLFDHLNSKGLYCERFHGGMEQPDRERALYKYRNASCHVLVSTDLAARGLDITDVGQIIHYHLPSKEDAFTHRNGRTARWEATGCAYVILNEEENIPDYLPKMQEHYLPLPHQVPAPPKPLWATLYIGKGKKDKLSRMDIAGFLYKKGGLVRDEVGQIDVKEHYAFVTIARSKTKELLAKIKGEKIKGMKTVIQLAR